MPRHKAELYCLKEKGSKTSDMCSCQHCTLAVCRVCGCYEGGLTTDCPGVKVSQDVSELIYKDGLDYVDGKGWFIIPKEERDHRSWNFEPTSKDIIKRLSEYEIKGATMIRDSDLHTFKKLRDDAQYWLEHPEGRQ